MLNYAVDWAKKREFKKLEANIFTTNKKSLHLFERAGFVEEGTGRNGSGLANNISMRY